MRWEREEIVLRDGSREEAIAPTILSASRATDVPAFYADWFWNRIRAGYFRWANPFNARQTQAIATSRVRAVVFWSKNPGPLTGGLDELDRSVLRAIIEMYGGGPVGLETLAAALGEESVTLEDICEPYLMQMGMLTRTPRGRCVTRLAYEHLHMAVPKRFDDEDSGQTSMF